MVTDDLAKKLNPSLHPVNIQDAAPVAPEVYNLVGSRPGEAQLAADKYATALQKARQGLGPEPKRSAAGTFVENEHGHLVEPPAAPGGTPSPYPKKNFDDNQNVSGCRHFVGLGSETSRRLTVRPVSCQ